VAGAVRPDDISLDYDVRSCGAADRIFAPTVASASASKEPRGCRRRVWHDDDNWLCPIGRQATFNGRYSSTQIRRVVPPLNH
jgi:hypothetical protein